jgi:nucleotide-binding universal stress UspA family protein
MYRHILIPTDGSELSKLALEEGIALAKALNARVTVITVTTPFHVITSDPVMLADTPERYKEHIPRRRKKDCGGGWSRVRFDTC